MTGYLNRSAFPVGAHERREAAIAICLMHHFRALVLLMRAYKVKLHILCLLRGRSAAAGRLL